MIGEDMDEIGSRFLMELYNRTDGDSAVQASMFEIGEAMGLDRDSALKKAEELIGFKLVAIKTLSGGIGITDDGIAEAHQLGCDAGGSTGSGPASLGDDLILDDDGCRSVEQIVAVLKTQAGEKSWDFNTLTELMADLKTIDAQMISSRPKTAIVRECFRSIKGVLEETGNSGDSLAQVHRLLGM